MMPRRAFSDDEKRERRREILDAASALFLARPYEDVTMADIARRAGLGKGTLYSYYRTKEELFLGLARFEMAAFFEDLEQRLRPLAAPAGSGKVVEALGRAIATRPEMRRLLALLHLVLERNVPFEAALEFRRALLPRLERAGRELERHLPMLTRGGGARLLLWIHAIALGFQQVAEPAPVIRQVHMQPGMERYVLDFQEGLLGSVELMLLGMEARAYRR